MKKYKIILIIALIVVCLFMYYLNAHTTIFHDEFVYSCIYGTNDRISNLKDVALSTYNLYQMHNGRAITHMLLMVCLLLPKFVRDILNSIFITTLLAELIYFSTRENKSGIQKITFIFFTIFLFWKTAPAFGETVMWFSGAVNYMWTSVFLLLYIVWTEKIFNQEKEYDNWKKIIYIISSFLLASTHEIVAVIMIAYIGLIWIYLLIKNRKINKAILYGIISAILGFLFIILSPGTNVRKQVNLQTTDTVVTLAQRIINCINMLVISMKENIFIFAVISTFLIVFIVLLIKKFRQVMKNKDYFSILFLLIGATLTYFAMVASPSFDKRVTFIPYIIYTFAGLKILNLNTNKKVIEYVKIGLVICVSCVYMTGTVKTIKETVDLMRDYEFACLKREQDIIMQKENGKKDIYVDSIVEPTNLYMYGGADLSTLKSMNQNGSMSAYYQVNSIRVKSNYYCDLELENVNKENCDSIMLRTELSQDKRKFYLIDKELYNKMAPYKRYKNTYNGGNIILYYSFGDINNLNLYFEKEQDITIKSLKIYDTEKILKEYKGKELILNSTLNNIDIKTQDNDNVKLHVYPASTIDINVI